MYWSTPLTLTAKFADLMGGVCRALAAQTKWMRANGPLAGLISRRLARMWTRLTGLAEQKRMGTLPARLPPTVPPRPRAAPPRPAAAPDQPRLPPQRFGWLLRTVPEPHHVAFWRGPLEELLADPETIALVAAAPQAGRLLRPLCSMLAMTPPEYLRLPPRPRRPRPPRPPRQLTPEQVGAKAAKMGRLAWAQFINPEIDGKPNGSRPPNRIGYGRQKPLIKRDPY